jgi:hypothetical protein
MHTLHEAAKTIEIIMHCDSTFKTNTVSYPVFVWGFSDAAGHFHLVALFISSQRREQDVTCMLTSISQEYEKVHGLPLQLAYVMGDADKATKNAVAQVYPEATYLMCYFHVIMSVSNIAS